MWAQMKQWTNQQKAQIALDYFWHRNARCPLDQSLLRIEDITGDGDRFTVIAALCPLCGNEMDSSDVQDEIAAKAAPVTTTRGSSAVTTTADAPKAFMSYSWDNNEHKIWVKMLATRLREDGVDVDLDQWSVVPGDQLPVFMERAIRENSYVIIICTPNYKAKSDWRKGGVGYEGDVMTAEVHTQQNHRKFIPVLRSGDANTAIPSWLAGKYRIDLSGDPFSEEQYRDLLVTLHNQREQAPALGNPPAPRTPHVDITPTRRRSVDLFDKLAPEPPGTPIRIVGVLADEVGEPRLDGTRGSALYEVPLKLNGCPPNEWSELFLRAWDHPPEFTTRHRPGIAEVHDNRIVLTRTTLEEVRDVHRKTLKLAVDQANTEYAALQAREDAQRDQARQQQQAHRDKVRDLADDIRFD